jgi:Family of unknown function (DUF5989)
LAAGRGFGEGQVFGLLIVLSGTAVAPFIYTLF